MDQTRSRGCSRVLPCRRRPPQRQRVAAEVVVDAVQAVDVVAAVAPLAQALQEARPLPAELPQQVADAVVVDEEAVPRLPHHLHPLRFPL